MLKAKYETFFVIIFMFINYEYLMYVGMISFILLAMYIVYAIYRD